MGPRLRHKHSLGSLRLAVVSKCYGADPFFDAELSRYLIGKWISKVMQFSAKDQCPYCREGLHIVCVKFKLSRATMLFSCPNCAAICSDDSNAIFKSGVVTEVAEENLKVRFRHVLAFLLVALIVAATLRHTIHIYGGISPEQIRLGTVVLLLALFSLVLALKNRRRL
jgi:hypothetical protein